MLVDQLVHLTVEFGCLNASDRVSVSIHPAISQDFSDYYERMVEENDTQEADRLKLAQDSTLNRIRVAAHNLEQATVIIHPTAVEDTTEWL